MSELGMYSVQGEAELVRLESAAPFWKTLLERQMVGFPVACSSGFLGKFCQVGKKRSDAFPKHKSCKCHLGSGSQARSLLACAFSSVILA